MIAISSPSTNASTEIKTTTETATGTANNSPRSSIAFLEQVQEWKATRARSIDHSSSSSSSSSRADDNSNSSSCSSYSTAPSFPATKPTHEAEQVVVLHNNEVNNNKLYANFTEKDILFGRGKFIQDRPSNVYFLNFVDTFRDAYNAAPNHFERNGIVRRIVDSLQGDGYIFRKHGGVSSSAKSNIFPASKQSQPREDTDKMDDHNNAGGVCNWVEASPLDVIHKVTNLLTQSNRAGPQTQSGGAVGGLDASVTCNKSVSAVAKAASSLSSPSSWNAINLSSNNLPTVPSSLFKTPFASPLPQTPPFPIQQQQQQYQQLQQQQQILSNSHLQYSSPNDGATLNDGHPTAFLSQLALLQTHTQQLAKGFRCVGAEAATTHATASKVASQLASSAMTVEQQQETLLHYEKLQQQARVAEASSLSPSSFSQFPTAPTPVSVTGDIKLPAAADLVTGDCQNQPTVMAETATVEGGGGVVAAKGECFSGFGGFREDGMLWSNDSGTRKISLLRDMNSTIIPTTSYSLLPTVEQEAFGGGGGQKQGGTEGHKTIGYSEQRVGNITIVRPIILLPKRTG